MRLLRLTIDDFGLIAHAEVEFAAGLTVFSGETGSGKTMLLGALRFALGERTEAEMIRAGAARARVVLEIEPDDALRARLAENGIVLAADDDAIITRELLSTGRSQARVNGIAASASQLRALGGSIVDIVGQHDAQRLLTPAFALETLDRFGGQPVSEAAGNLRRLYGDLRTVKEQLADLHTHDASLFAELDFARFAAAEIDAAALEAGEDDRLRERRDVLDNAERIRTALGSAQAALADEGGAIDALGAAAGALSGIARFSPIFAALGAAVGGLQSDANDLAARLARESEAVEADPAELESVLARLETLDRLKQKYGGSLTAVIESRSRFGDRIERDATRDERIALLEADAARLTAQLDAAARELSAKRRAAALELASRVAAELAGLAMPAARFSVAFEPLDRIGPAGAEAAQLLLAPNPGEPQRPIAKSASGGELSRVLLALIVAIADRREPTALVFDEIDAGIGGATAVAVGARLGQLARGAQIVAVTHLAQIASWADAHYALRKRDARGAAVIVLETLGAREARLEEIARMLSGDTNPISLEHAATLVAVARPA